MQAGELVRVAQAGGSVALDDLSIPTSDGWITARLHATLPPQSGAFFLLGSQSLQAIFNIDVIWLMVLMLITMEISLLTPPFGLLLYVMKGVAPFDVTLGEVVRSAMPFILIELLVLVLLIAAPGVATWLPKLLN